MLMGDGVRFVIRGVYFVVIARALGSSEYGAFIGVAALVSALSPFATAGSGDLLVKNVARQRELLPAYWGNALVLTGASGAVLVGITLLVSRLALPGNIPLRLVLMVAVADIFCARVVDLAGKAFQAVEKLSTAARLNVIASSLRLGAAVLAVSTSWHQLSAFRWAGFYLVSSALGAAIALVVVRVRLARARLALDRVRGEFAEGVYFAVAQSTQTVYNDIDKTMLARMVSLEAAGIYAAAYRFIEIAFVPVASLMAAAYPNFFRHGSGGLHACVGYARKLMRHSGAYGALASLGLFLSAPLVPHLLGHQYEQTALALRWLAPIPLFKSLRYFLADSLTGSGHQGLRTVIHSAAAGFNVILNLWLLPAYSWRGAAWSSLASDLVLFVSLWVAIAILTRRERRRISPEAWNREATSAPVST